MIKKSLKTLSLLALTFFVAIVATGCGTKEADETDALFTPGTYEGTADGYGGEITATVTVTADEITEIEIDMPDETPSIAGTASEIIVENVLASQSVDVDVVSGATSSSEGIIGAITAALNKAGADAADLAGKDSEKEEEAAQEDIDVDVVVVGAGGAGMAAAIEVAEAGKSVIILEKMPITGGNTNYATGGMNASETSVQEAEGIEDSNDVFYADTLKGGQEKNDPELLSTLIENSASAVDWLNDMGAGLTRVSLSGGATNPRIHTPADGSPVGPVIMTTLSDKLAELEVEIMLETKAVKINETDGVVIGVEANDKDGNSFMVNADAVILTTGGFGANSEMVESYREDLVGFSTTNHPGALGDGIVMALEVGASLTDIEEIQIHPTTDPETGSMFTEGLRGDGAILINKEGKRFTDELLTRDVVSKNILDQTDGIAYLITNDAMRQTNASLDGYIEQGLTIDAGTIEELAEALEIDAATLTQTMEDYEAAVQAGEDTEFGREHLDTSLIEGGYYAMEVTPGIHHTMGGVTIDTETHVLNEAGDIIEGLYAAGEVVGGIHGANRIGGNAVTDIIVFGRIAGQTVGNK